MDKDFHKFRPTLCCSICLSKDSKAARSPPLAPLGIGPRGRLGTRPGWRQKKMVKIIGCWCWSSFSSWRPRTLEFGKVVGLGSDLIVGQGRGMEPRDRLDTCPSWRQILVRVLINDHSWSGWSCWYLPLCLPPVIFKFLVAKLGKKGIFWGQKRPNPVFFMQRKSVNKNICNKCSLLQ